MNYYEQLKFAKENNLSVLDMYCASSAEWFLKDYCGLEESDPSYIHNFNYMTGSIKKAYINIDHVSFGDIEDNLMFLRDNYKNLSFEEIGDNLIDCITNQLGDVFVEEDTLER